MKLKKPGQWPGFFKKLAATYSRGGYTTTTIGNAAFDVRVRDGIGSSRSFMATKKSSKITNTVSSLKTTHKWQIIRIVFVKRRSSLTTD